MATITPLNLEEIKVGASSTFRAGINNNFDKIKKCIEEIIDSNTTIVLSRTQPPAGTLSTGGLWLKEL